MTCRHYPVLYTRAIIRCRLFSLGQQKHLATGFTGYRRNMWTVSRTPFLEIGSSFSRNQPRRH